MSTFPKALLLGVVVLTVVCAKHGMGQSADSAKSTTVDHSTMTAEQHAAMHGDGVNRNDSAFAALQERGKMAMGVDQYDSFHEFDALPDGGRIALQMKDDDSLSVAQIRAHLKLIQHAFQAGDFSTPQFVHMRAMPGTDVMARRKAFITYAYSDLPRGGVIRITTSDRASLDAIRQFMAAQRGDHKAKGKAH